jgi:hypothetical protein
MGVAPRQMPHHCDGLAKPVRLSATPFFPIHGRHPRTRPKILGLYHEEGRYQAKLNAHMSELQPSNFVSPAKMQVLENNSDCVALQTQISLTSRVSRGLPCIFFESTVVVPMVCLLRFLQLR